MVYLPLLPDRARGNSLGRSLRQLDLISVKHARAPANSHSSSRVSRVGAAAGLLRGLRGGARGGAEVPATRGPIWRSVRCAATARDPTPPRRSPSRHGRASSLRTAISQHSHRWPRRSSLRDDDRPGGFSRPGGRARGGCRASGPIRRFTRASPTRHARGGEWTSPRGDIVAIRMTGSTTTPTRQMSAGAGKGST